jgi:hypothetical protein
MNESLRLLKPSFLAPGVYVPSPANTRRTTMPTLLQPDSERITPVEHKPTHDHAPEGLALGTPLWLRDDLVGILGEEQVHSRIIDLVKYATDASPYRMFPKVVVSPRTVDDVAKIFAYAQEKQVSVTIRSAGSSLSGRSQGDGILIDARKHWAGATVEDGGKRLRVQPGTVMFRANLALHPYGYRLGPAPASSGVATVGGVMANNASGMCCGTIENSYKTLESVSFLLPSGTRINTANPDAENQFNIAEPRLAAGLMEIKPIYATCCAFAGDRGFLHPELTHAATSEEVNEIGDQQFEKYVCSTRTCELGMNLATGKDYQSVIFLLEELTRPQAQDPPSFA